MQVGTQSRSSPAVIEAIQLLRDGEIGEVLIGKVWTVAYRAAVGDFDLLARRDFGLAVLELLRHQIVDDAALVGTLIREGLLHISPSVPLTEGEA